MNNEKLLYKKYAKELSKMVASNEFEKMLGKSVNSKIIKYSELENYNDLNDLLTENKDYRIILIETNFNTGHYCCLLKYNDNYFEWFDSYGFPPDVEFNFIPIHIQEILDEKYKILTVLLNKVLLKGGKYIFNDIKFQKQAANIDTCGRFCCFTLYMFLKYNYNLKMFQEFMINQKKLTNKPYDILICDFTKPLN